MENGIFFSIISLVFCIITCVAFFGKEKISTSETKLYGLLLIVNLIGLLIEVFPSSLAVKGFFGNSEILKMLPLKGLLIYLVVWTIIFTYYICLISVKDQKKLKNYQVFFTILFIVSFIIICYLPISYYYKDRVAYSFGPGTNFVTLVSALLVIICLAQLVMNWKVIFQKKYYPLFLFVVLGVIVIVIQLNFPGLTLLLSMHTVVTTLMYHTIENPDVRLVEYEKREKELAQSANEAKSAFLSSMSHELRTPLNAIVGLSEDMLSYKDQVPSEVKEDCEDIVNASNTLLEIIGNILDISKIEGGKLEIIEADYLPKEEIESLLKIMRTKVEEKDLKFNVFIDPNIPECLLGDRLRIKQIINNFLSNAIKYTESGSVDFGARWINNSLELKVRDTGRGIKKEDMDKLFEKFERLHVEKTSAVQGTGLGLAITKNLVDLMGGEIKVDSVYGQGSTFDVIIPQKIGNKDNIVREALTVEERRDIDFTGKKVLIVDDNKLNIKVLRKAISTFNFEIDECYNGEEALKKIDENKYDLIFMDIMMPVMGGEEAMGLLKQKEGFNTPVLALTADATTGAKERYLSIGFVDYLAKPFSRDTIAQKLENVFKDMK